MQETLVDYRKEYEFRPVDSFSCRRLSGAPTLAQVLEVLEHLRAAEPEQRFLCTLDDLNQCCYTSGHAGDDDRLTVDSRDVDFDDPQSVHAYESARLAHVVKQLQDSPARLDWTAVHGALAIDADDIQALAEMNRDPQRVLDDIVYVQRLPVANDGLMIAGLVNGYFSADLDVFQNHAVIRHLQDRHGYRFFGIGASWLGFLRAEPLRADEAGQLVQDLADLYGCRIDEAETAWHGLAQTVQTSKVLLLGYTENFSDFLE